MPDLQVGAELDRAVDPGLLLNVCPWCESRFDLVVQPEPEGVR